jgi:hypothetical protein
VDLKLDDFATERSYVREHLALQKTGFPVKLGSRTKGLRCVHGAITTKAADFAEG